MFLFTSFRPCQFLVGPLSFVMFVCIFKLFVLARLVDIGRQEINACQIWAIFDDVVVYLFVFEFGRPFSISTCPGNMNHLDLSEIPSESLKHRRNV